MRALRRDEPPAPKAGPASQRADGTTATPPRWQCAGGIQRRCDPWGPGRQPCSGIGIISGMFVSPLQRPQQQAQPALRDSCAQRSSWSSQSALLAWQRRKAARGEVDSTSRRALRASRRAHGGAAAGHEAVRQRPGRRPRARAGGASPFWSSAPRRRSAQASSTSRSAHVQQHPQRPRARWSRST